MFQFNNDNVVNAFEEVLKNERNGFEASLVEI
jgi:hypothetical protein